MLKGNAYENAIQSSVTVHGTHESTVDQNVMYNRSGITRKLTADRHPTINLLIPEKVEPLPFTLKMEMK